MDKFLIIGGDSKLADNFKHFYPNSIFLSKKDCDITSIKSVENIFKQYPSKYVLNCAAITNVEECEKDSKKCFSVNTGGVYTLNKLSHIYKKKLIHISSDYALFPTNNYGYSKFLSEKLVSKEFLILRTSFYSSENYIVKNILNKVDVDAYQNVYFNPVSAIRIAKEIYKTRNEKGILNIFSNKKLSKYEFAIEVCKVFNHTSILVHPTTYLDSSNATRPLDTYILSDKNIGLKEDLFEYKKFLLNNPVKL